MTKTPVGTRVGAILSANEDEVCLLGFGVYDGEHEHPAVAEMHAELKAAGELPANFPPFTNPRITLDDGRVVWGFQCWWGPEDAVRRRIEGLKVIPATV